MQHGLVFVWESPPPLAPLEAEYEPGLASSWSNVGMYSFLDTPTNIHPGTVLCSVDHGTVSGQRKKAAR